MKNISFFRKITTIASC